VESLAEGQTGEVFLDRTPFYAEAGGQVGDTGTVTGEGSFVVEDAQKAGDNAVAHLGRMAVGTVRVGEEVIAAIDAERRHEIARHHSATHLLHRALCDVLGVPGPIQRGSWVGPTHTTFDFPLGRALERDELQTVMAAVNEHVRAGLPFQESLLPYQDAVKTRAMHLFEEKYGDVVRVVCFGDWTCEFCGGTHVTNTADIGLALIISESSIGAGLRRIDMVVGDAARRLLMRRFTQVGELARLLGTSADEVTARVEQLQAQLRETEKRLRATQEELRSARVQGPAAGAKRVEGTRVPVVMETVDAGDMKDLGDYADRFLETLNGSGVVAVIGDGRYVIKVSRDLATEFDANLLKRAFGQGGGSPVFVQGRLEKTSSEAFAELKEMLS
jgi:alanyl-tRNA synthetase